MNWSNYFPPLLLAWIWVWGGDRGGKRPEEEWGLETGSEGRRGKGTFSPPSLRDGGEPAPSRPTNKPAGTGAIVGGAGTRMLVVVAHGEQQFRAIKYNSNAVDAGGTEKVREY